MTPAGWPEIGITLRLSDAEVRSKRLDRREAEEHYARLPVTRPETLDDLALEAAWIEHRRLQEAYGYETIDQHEVASRIKARRGREKAKRERAKQRAEAALAKVKATIRRVETWDRARTARAQEIANASAHAHSESFTAFIFPVLARVFPNLIAPPIPASEPDGRNLW